MGDIGEQCWRKGTNARQIRATLELWTADRFSASFFCQLASLRPRNVFFSIRSAQSCLKAHASDAHSKTTRAQQTTDKHLLANSLTTEIRGNNTGTADAKEKP